MTNDVPIAANDNSSIPQEVQQRPIPWVPGEILVGVNVDVATDTQPVIDGLRRVVSALIGDIQVEDPESRQPALTIPTLRGQQRLLFEPITLGSREPQTVKRAVTILNGAAARKRLDDMGFQLIAATPNWFSCSAQDCSGGSPASQPVPVKPYGSRVRYAPLSHVLDLVEAAKDSAWAKTGSRPDGVHVAVLDTAPTQTDLDAARRRYPENAHLQDLLGQLVSPIGSLSQLEFEQARQSALAALDVNDFHPIEPSVPYDLRDHGLFVAGALLATAPWVHLRLVRVLNNHGVGSFRSLLIALMALSQNKLPNEPLVINLSLGMLPAHEQLPDIWFGLPIEGLPGCPEDATLQFLPDGTVVSRERLQNLVAQRNPSVSAIIAELEDPVRRLMGALQAHNCLVVAAAGNDSVFRGRQRAPRWDPRVPARYDEVLGVAADTTQPTVPASYSNRGDLPDQPIRDAVATLGGNLAPDGVSPTGAIVGVYTAEKFPSLGPGAPVPNATGWAEWAGTSFATPIMAGIACNFLASYPAEASQTLAAMNAAFRFGSPTIGDLGVPAVPLRFSWVQ